MNEAGPVTWFVVALAFISMVGSVAAGVIAAVVKIAQIRADAGAAERTVKIGQLETQNATQANQIQSLGDSQAKCEENHEKCEEQHAVTEKKLEECEENHKSVDVRVTALETAAKVEAVTKAVKS